MNPEVEQFIRDFKSARYYNRKIIKLNEALEAKEHQLIWGRRDHPDLTPEQLKSPLPMPTNTNRFTSRWDWDLWTEIERIREEIAACQSEIMKCIAAEGLSEKEFGMLADRYWFGISPYDWAEKYGYSKSGIYKRLDSRLSRLLNMVYSVKKAD